MQTSTEKITYGWGSSRPTYAQGYVFPSVLGILERAQGLERRVFDLGCGNGSVAKELASRGWSVAGVDPSEDGIAYAKQTGLDLRIGSAYDDLRAEFGTWPFVISIEVVEHVYDPHRWARCAHDLLEPNGILIASTPYHGFAKNLALSLIPGAWDRHWHPLRTHGHIKFWSKATLSALLRSAGFRDLRFAQVGRIPMLGKSIVVSARA